jgi:heat shock protein HtpX
MIRNIVHSTLLILSMLLLSSGLGWLMWGTDGLFWLGIFGVGLLILGHAVSPQIVLKMYKARQLSERDAPYLMRMVNSLAGKAQLPAMPRVYYVPSRIANAFAVGTRKNGAIAVTDGLLRNFSSRELQGVLAHELGHLNSNDGWVMSLADSLSQLVSLMSWIGQFLLIINLPLFLWGDYQIPWLFIIILVLAPTVSALLQLALSRTREFEADLQAAMLTGDPRGLASGLAKLERISGNWFENLFLPGRRVPEPSLLRTHPPTEERVRRLLELEQDLTHEIDKKGHSRDLLLSSQAPVMSPPRWHVSRFWY